MLVISLQQSVLGRRDLQDFNKLKVWDKAHQPTLAVYRTTVLSSRHNQAPKERHSLAHGVSRGLKHPPCPLPPLPHVRERGAEGGVRAFKSQGLRSGLELFAASRLSNGSLRPWKFVNEPVLDHNSELNIICSSLATYHFLATRHTDRSKVKSSR